MDAVPVDIVFVLRILVCIDADNVSVLRKFVSLQRDTSIYAKKTSIYRIVSESSLEANTKNISRDRILKNFKVRDWTLKDFYTMPRLIGMFSTAIEVDNFGFRYNVSSTSVSGSHINT